MPEKLPDSAQRMLREVGDKQRRMEKARAGNFWDSLALPGVIGWSVAVPVLAGVIAGVWLDRHFPARFSWALVLLFTGLVFGCINAWFHMRGGRP